MIVFVDGHNVLGTLQRFQRRRRAGDDWGDPLTDARAGHAVHVLGVDAGNHEADRGALIADVRERVRKLTPGATVFFDGHPPGGEFASSQSRGVQVVFSLSREADDAIVDAVRDADEAGRILVVTDDLELARRVAQLGAKTTRVRKFFSRGAPAEEHVSEKPSDSGGFTAADFGLPEVIDLNDRRFLSDGPRTPGTPPKRPTRRRPPAR